MTIEINRIKIITGEKNMIGYFITVLVTALSLLIVDVIFPGVSISSFPTALLAGVVIGFVNAFIRPVLQLVSLPVTFVTLGAFSFILNGILLWVASLIVPGFVMGGIFEFIFAPVVLSFSSTFLNKYFAEKGIGQA
jgi:putative membrane protein